MQVEAGLKISKKRFKLHNVSLSGEAASADKIMADQFVEQFPAKFLSEYSLQQIINVDETGLMWKRMPRRTFIAQFMKSVPGSKACKERLTLLLGGNANGTLKLKPFLIHTSENPRTFKYVDKNKLGVYWRSNKKAWMTSSLFLDWIKNCLFKELKAFSKINNIPFKFLILLDNAPGHSKLELLNNFCPGLTFHFFPPNTTSLIQPMDQGVISTFKIYYLKRSYQSVLNVNQGFSEAKEMWKKYSIADAVNHIVSSWDDISSQCIAGCWKKLLPFSLDVSSNVNEMESVIAQIEELAANLEITGMERSDLMEIINDTSEYTVYELMEFENETMNGDSDTETDEEFETKINQKDLSYILNTIRQLKI